MYSIMEAVEAAQKRNAERDRLNQQRSVLFPVAQPVTQPVMPTSYNDGGGGDGPGYEDTRTEHEKYQDAIDANQYIGAVPVVGPILGMLNDSFIEDYEAKNPNMVVGGPNKFSTVGRIQGKGLTVEEQLAAKGAGLGLGKALGFGDQAGQPGYTLMDRVFGTTPMNIAKEADYIGVAPNMTGGGWETGGGDNDNGPAASRGTTNFGGRESSMSYDDYSGYA